jgi:hypothetical protein
MEELLTATLFKTLSVLKKALMCIKLKNSFKTNTQLKLLEVIFLAKQKEILHRTSPKIKTKRTDRLFFSLRKDLLSNWKDRIFIVKQETVIKWHRSDFYGFLK